MKFCGEDMSETFILERWIEDELAFMPSGRPEGSK
jgi:hypothetical protein